MCVERLQRYLTAIAVGLASYLIYSGVQEGVYLLWFISAMLFVWGTTNFCPSIWMLKKVGVPTCKSFQ